MSVSPETTVVLRVINFEEHIINGRVISRRHTLAFSRVYQEHSDDSFLPKVTIDIPATCYYSIMLDT